VGIDYGERRIGLAYADEIGVALPIPAATGGDPETRLEQVVALAKARRVDALIVGYPYNMDDSIGYKAREVDDFIALLEPKVGVPIHRVDERLTTHAAQAGVEATGRKGKRDRKTRNSGDIDSRAAALILQDYLDASGCVPPALLPEEEL